MALVDFNTELCMEFEQRIHQSVFRPKKRKKCQCAGIIADFNAINPIGYNLQSARPCVVVVADFNNKRMSGGKNHVRVMTADSNSGVGEVFTQRSTLKKKKCQ